MKLSVLKALNEEIVSCEACPRLRAHCRRMAAQKRASFRDEEYWGRPVPNFLPRGRAELAPVLMVGLAPAAHGANRTGRMFTGDRSGDFLFRALHATGFASQPTGVRADDRLRLDRLLITATAHCAPPDNKPTPEEIATCSQYLDRTIDAMPRLKVVVSLGRIGHDAVLRAYQRRGLVERLKAYPFAHGAEYQLPGGPVLLATFHPSQQNTFTGRLTPAMLEAVLSRARELANMDHSGASPAPPDSR